MFSAIQSMHRMTLFKGRIRFFAFCISLIILILGCAIFLSALAGRLENDTFQITRCYTVLGLIEVFLGALGCIFFYNNDYLKKNQLTAYEAFFTITSCWCITSLLGAVPFLFESLKIEDAVMESFSMFTTTGSVLTQGTVLSNGEMLIQGINSLSGALIFYRSIGSWLGGMGTIALLLIFLPLFRQKNQILPYAEVSGLKSFERRVSSRLAFSAWKICIVYVLLTVLLLLLLTIVTNDKFLFFDALCCALTTISTSGSGSDDVSVFAYGTGAVCIITVFMVLASFNFNIYVLTFSNLYRVLRDGKRASRERAKFLFLNDETLFFVITCLVSTSLIAGALLWQTHSMDHLKDDIMVSVFTAVSFMSTTGFAPDSAVAFPVSACVLLFVINFCGGCSGSTASGLKSFRCIIIFKQCVLEIKRIFFPHLVTTVYLNKERRDISAIHKIFAFFALYVMVLLSFTILLPLCSPDSFHSVSDAFATSLACLTNTGLSCGETINGTSTFASFDCSNLNIAAKLLMCLEMVLGRLEIYTVLVLLLPHFGKDR